MVGVGPPMRSVYRFTLSPFRGGAVVVQWDDRHVRLLDPTTGALLREHRRQTRGRHAIHPDDQPPRTPPTTLTLLARAARAGDPIGTLCAAIHRRDGERGVRRILGVLALVKKHGAAVVTDACAAAVELGVADYRFVRRYLERQAPAARTLRHHPELGGVPPFAHVLVESAAGGSLGSG